MEVASRLLQIIEKSKLSYTELEKITGIAKSSIQRYATGKTKKVPIDAVKAIADAVGGSAAWVMGWDDEEEKPQEETLELSKYEEKVILSLRSVPEEHHPMVLEMIQVAIKNLES